MRFVRTLLLTIVTVGLLAAVAVGSGWAVRHYAGDDPSAVRATGVPAAQPSTPSTSSPSPSTAAEPSADPAPSPSATPSPTPPPPVLKPGEKGEPVRELQHRLFQLAWWGELTTGAYDAETKDAVAGFQAKRGFTATGVVDQRTWKRLVAMTRTPTHDEKFNILHPGPALLGPGSTGDDVRELQARLKQIAWYAGDVTGIYGEVTTEAVRGFQAKRVIPVTGEVDQRTLDRLHAMTREPTHDELHNVVPDPTAGGALHPSCQTGRALCVDKSTNTMTWVVDGQVLRTFEVRFGSDELPTREGAFSVFAKSRDHVSSLYDTPMPFAMFFSGGQAVHYSPDFAANGYNGASHGCVNVRDYDGIVWLFDQVQIGDKVIVHWS